jgi:hypothetical protein
MECTCGAAGIVKFDTSVPADPVYPAGNRRMTLRQNAGIEDSGAPKKQGSYSFFVF